MRTRIDRRRLATALAALLVAARLPPAAAAEEPAPGAGAAGATVTIDNFTFAPERLVVAPGTTVTWINRDDIPHTVVAADKTFRSAALDTDDRFAFTFVTPGTVAYFCSLHPHMRATIVVEAGAPPGRT